MDYKRIAEAAKTSLKNASNYIFFDDNGVVFASTLTATPADLSMLAAVLDDREEAIKKGMVVGGTRYEVHRHHPPLVYGRTMGVEPETSVGAAICKVEKGITGCSCYGFVTYEMPNISARMVPMLQNFCADYLESK